MLKFAVRNLLSRPVRSTLAVLGLTVAIAGMVGLFSIAEGIDRQVASAFGRIPGLAVMQVGAPIPLFSRLPAEWGEEIAAVDGVAVVNPEVWDRANIIDGKPIFSPPRFLLGVDIPSRLRLKHGVYDEAIVEGRFLSLEDIGKSRAVISRQIAEEFDKKVGDAIEVNGQDLTIVGMYHSGLLLLDGTIILEIDQLRSMGRIDRDSVSAFYVEREDGSDEEAVAEGIRERLRGKSLRRSDVAGLLANHAGQNPLSRLFADWDRALKSGATGSQSQEAASGPTPTIGQLSNESPGPDSARAEASPGNARDRQVGDVPVEVRTSADWGDRFEEFSADLNIFLTLMTTIGVTVAILSIVNTMLMSVSERIIEFGILKANGWSRGHVMRLVTAESALLGIAGGLLGAVAGWVATQVVNWYWGAQIHLFASPGLLLFSVAFATVLGILGGLYPAIWAMRMMPMDAIRRG